MNSVNGGNVTTLISGAFVRKIETLQMRQIHKSKKIRGRNHGRQAYICMSSFVRTRVVMLREIAALTNKVADVSSSSQQNVSTMRPEVAATRSTP